MMTCITTLLVLRGPRPEQSGLSGRTLADLCHQVEASWGMRFHPASMSRVVRRLGFSRQKARQVHPQSDAQAQAAFEKGPQRALDDAAAAHPGRRVTLWFEDEARVGQNAAPAIAGG